MKFQELFGNTPIIGMIHLAGNDPVKRALNELAIFEEEGIDGAIIENYHGSTEDVEETLKAISKQDHFITLGVNILANDYSDSFPLAAEYGADFIQIDNIAGTYTRGTRTYSVYSQLRQEHPDIVVLGGVWPKYYEPINPVKEQLRHDLLEGMQRSDAIVVTGEGTGKETPIEKIRYFREVLGDHPLIDGAGITPENAFEQLSICDGAIVGTYLKADGPYEPNTFNHLDRIKIRDLMDVVREVRKYKG
jgi:predicted TIM-barrel enzyme